MASRLEGKIALVTGTSRGLGQYFARALAKAGADLAITSRDKDSLSGFAGEIQVPRRNGRTRSGHQGTGVASAGDPIQGKGTNIGEYGV